MDQQRLCELASDIAASALQPLFERASAVAEELHEGGLAAQREILLEIVRRVVIAQDKITLHLNVPALRNRIGLGNTDDSEDIQIRIPFTIRRRGVEARLIIGNTPQPAKPDAKLVHLLIQACRWFNDLRSRKHVGIHGLSKWYGADPSDISRILPLAFLAPDIVEAILDGCQPPELTAARLKRMRDIPLDWQQQRRYLGFE